MKGKLILIEGTDCSGKETQSNLLIERLIKNGYKVFKMSFPAYETPTGRIVGGPYLGKESIGESYFKEGAVKLDPKVTGHYFAADRLYNKPIIEEHLNKGEIVILDRYVTSNMAHQGSKCDDYNERIDYYNWCINMEYVNNKLPIPDATIFLHMPFEAACELKKNRLELDELEQDENHLRKAEATYVELASLYNFKTIRCLKTKSYEGVLSIKTIEEISDIVYESVINILNEKVSDE